MVCRKKKFPPYDQFFGLSPVILQIHHFQHIIKVHPKEAPKVSPISNLEKYADEIRELQVFIAFAPRVVPLLPPFQSTTPSPTHPAIPPSLQTRCFPNRQMKLVRPVASSNRSRPRERHQCGICGVDVAQSDRQRHVFHKHLRKGKVGEGEQRAAGMAWQYQKRHFPKIFECPLCEFSSNYDIHRVKWHIK